MEKASRRSFQETKELREYALREFWEIFVDDGPLFSDACFKHANVQPKAVCSDAMAIMDAIYGWEDEEKRVGSKIRGVHVDLHQSSADHRTNTQPGNGGAPEETNDVHKNYARTVFVLAFSRITNGCQKAQSPSMWKNWWLWNNITRLVLPCVVQLCMLWFSAPTRLNEHWEKTRYENFKVSRGCQPWRISKQFRDLLEGSAHRGRACWRLWQIFYTIHTESGE